MHYPSVYISPSIDRTVLLSLTEIVERHSGTVVGNENEATHVVVEDPSPDVNDDSTEYVRVQQVRDKFAFVHWWYYPDSYDTWINYSEIKGSSGESLAPHTGKWIVTSKWITDMDEFNEYMIERDYAPASKSCTKHYVVSNSTGVGKKRTLSTDATSKCNPIFIWSCM